ncbi:ribbon-helix-helix protein, CopG family [Saccharomonospora halophila]|uniref:ribbon-helix-helix protein, CopG family n=1 Tax=Saccharomonospora halophila TaxID=129922 RepID=UPI000363DF14|nr:ribbon-helix-helix protein, CopG family [Saccharomonospora halophila]
MTRKDTETEGVDLDREPVFDRQGRRITEDEVNRAGEALETGDVAVHEVDIVYPRRGRPSLTTPGVHSPRVDTRVSREVKNHLESLAHTQHRSESEIVREALEEYLARH